MSTTKATNISELGFTEVSNLDLQKLT